MKSGIERGRWAEGGRGGGGWELEGWDRPGLHVERVVHTLYIQGEIHLYIQLYMQTGDLYIRLYIRGDCTYTRDTFCMYRSGFVCTDVCTSVCTFVYTRRRIVHTVYLSTVHTFVCTFVCTAYIRFEKVVDREGGRG